MLNLADIHAKQQCTISIYDKDGEHRIVAVCQVLYIIADGNYSHITYIWENDYRTSIQSHNLASYTNFLTQMHFMQIHKSHLINLAMVQGLNNKYHHVTMKDKQQLHYTKHFGDQLHALFL